MYARRTHRFFPEQECDPGNSARMNKSNFTTEEIV